MDKTILALTKDVVSSLILLYGHISEKFFISGLRASMAWF